MHFMAVLLTTIFHSDKLKLLAPSSLRRYPIFCRFSLIFISRMKVWPWLGTNEKLFGQIILVLHFAIVCYLYFSFSLSATVIYSLHRGSGSVHQRADWNSDFTRGPHCCPRPQWQRSTFPAASILRRHQWGKMLLQVLHTQMTFIFLRCRLFKFSLEKRQEALQNKGPQSAFSFTLSTFICQVSSFPNKFVDHDKNKVFLSHETFSEILNFRFLFSIRNTH